MGWGFTYGATRADIIKEIIHEQHNVDEKDGSTHHYKCLEHCIRGRVLWTVFEYTKTPKNGTPKVDRFIGCDLIGREAGYGAGHKSMCESMGPVYYSCPLSYLDMVPVACEDWRVGVRQYHANCQAQRSLLKIGQTVKLVDGLTVKGMPLPEVCVTSLRPLRGTYAGMNIRIKPRHVKLEEAANLV